MLKFSKEDMEKMEKACSKQAGKDVNAIKKCQRKYFVRVKWVAPTGSTLRKRQLATLPAIPATPPDFIIHCFVDTNPDSHHYDNSRVPEGEFIHRRDGELNLRIDEEMYTNARRIFIWAEGMRASFWQKGRHDDFATGRLSMKILREADEQYDHVLIFEAQMLISPVDYLVSEIVKNMQEDIVKDTQRNWPAMRKSFNDAKAERQRLIAERRALMSGGHGERWLREKPLLDIDNKIGAAVGKMKEAEKFLMRWVAVNGEKDLLGADTTAVVLYGLQFGQYGQWDYKPRVSEVWGDYVRLGNYSKACPSGGFSNFHYGYISAAAGLSKATTLGLGNWGQQVATATDDPEEDRFATSQGHDAFNPSDDQEQIRTKLMSFLKKYVEKYGVTSPFPPPPPKLLKSTWSAIVAFMDAKWGSIADIEKNVRDGTKASAEAAEAAGRRWVNLGTGGRFLKEFDDSVWAD